MFKKSLVVAVPALVALLALAGPSSAQNLLTNPGFETGNLTGWTDAGNTGWNVVTTVPHTGTFGISNGAVGSPSLLQQTVITTPGQNYQVCGWLRNDGAGQFQIQWNGVFIPGTADTFTSHDYLQFCGTAVGTGSDTVTYSFRDDPGFVNFDDASVVAAIPEPGSFSLLGVGIASSLMFVVRRRRRK